MINFFKQLKLDFKKLSYIYKMLFCSIYGNDAYFVVFALPAICLVLSAVCLSISSLPSLYYLMVIFCCIFMFVCVIFSIVCRVLDDKYISEIFDNLVYLESGKIYWVDNFCYNKIDFIDSNKNKFINNFFGIVKVCYIGECSYSFERCSHDNFFILKDRYRLNGNKYIKGFNRYYELVLRLSGNNNEDIKLGFSGSSFLERTDYSFDGIKEINMEETNG